MYLGVFMYMWLSLINIGRIGSSDSGRHDIKGWITFFQRESSRYYFCYTPLMCCVNVGLNHRKSRSSFFLSRY
jgi:hypothetical protein